MPKLAPRPKYDDQTDYEDPMDRYLRRPRGSKAKKPPSAAAKSAMVLGIFALMPCIGLGFAPITLLVALGARAELKRNDRLGGQQEVSNAFWFAGIGGFINYGIPILFYSLAFIARK